MVCFATRCGFVSRLHNLAGEAMNVTSPRLLRYLDYEVSGIGLDLPNELVPAEHFAGSELCSHRFSFYGETFDLPADIDPDDIDPALPSGRLDDHSDRAIFQ